MTPQKWLKTSAGLLFKNTAWCDSNMARNNTATFGSDVKLWTYLWLAWNIHCCHCVGRRNIKPSLLPRVVLCWSVVSGPCDVQCTYCIRERKQANPGNLEGRVQLSRSKSELMVNQEPPPPPQKKKPDRQRVRREGKGSGNSAPPAVCLSGSVCSALSWIHSLPLVWVVFLDQNWPNQALFGAWGDWGPSRAPPSPTPFSPQKRNMQLCVRHFPKYSCYATKCTKTARWLPDMPWIPLARSLLALRRSGLCLLHCFVFPASKMLDFSYRWFLLTASHPLTHAHT